jgi:hypothetical protein
MPWMTTLESERVRILPRALLEEERVGRRRAVPPLVVCNLLVWLVNLVLVFKPLGT